MMRINQPGVTRYQLSLCGLLLILLLASLTNRAGAQGAAVNAIGEVVLAKGVVSARSDSRPLTALAKGSPVYLGDIIETAARSAVVIEFTDGGKLTLRPDSRIDLHEYDISPGQEKESFELIKGGLRAITGAIGKARPEKVTYTARNTTIGIRGTTFVIKLCQQGVEGCQLHGGDETEGDENQLVDIFLIDKQGGTRQRITRKQLQDLLQGVYVSVIEGAIRLETDQWYIDMSAGDKCLIDFSGAATECFESGPGLEDIDPYLNGEIDAITVFNLFDGLEIFAGNEICEIN